MTNLRISLNIAIVATLLATAACSGTAVDVYDYGTETAEFNYTQCNGDYQVYATVKFESDLLHLATGECGGSTEDRCTDFSEGTTYSRLAEADIPVPTAPVKTTPKLCLQ